MPLHPPDQDPQERAQGREIRLSILVVLAALLILRLPTGAQDSVAAGVRGTVLRPFLALQEYLVEQEALAIEAGEFRARIDTLTMQVVASTTLAEENRRLRGLLELAGRVGPRWRPVELLRPGTPDAESTLHVRRGTDHGIADRSPIITREGLAGVIIKSEPAAAVGMDWTHPDFRASAMTVDGLHYGVVRSDAGLFREQARLRFEGLPFHADVAPGTMVVTSGLGGVFPRGIPIGRVADLATQDAEWRKSFWLEPQVSVGSITLALVAVQGTDGPDDLTPVWEDSGYLREEERITLEGALQDTVRILRDSLAALERRWAQREGGGA